MPCKLDGFVQFEKLTFYPQTQMHSKTFDGEGWLVSEDPTHEVESKIFRTLSHMVFTLY